MKRRSFLGFISALAAMMGLKPAAFSAEKKWVYKISPTDWGEMRYSHVGYLDENNNLVVTGSICEAVEKREKAPPVVHWLPIKLKTCNPKVALWTTESEKATCPLDCACRKNQPI